MMNLNEIMVFVKEWTRFENPEFRRTEDEIA